MTEKYFSKMLIPFDTQCFLYDIIKRECTVNERSSEVHDSYCNTTI